MQSLLHDGHKHVNRDGDPDLGLHGVLGSPIKILDPKMLLDPFEEQFHPPAAFVKLGDDDCRKRKVVG